MKYVHMVNLIRKICKYTKEISLDPSTQCLVPCILSSRWFSLYLAPIHSLLLIPSSPNEVTTVLNSSNESGLKNLEGWKKIVFILFSHKESVLKTKRATKDGNVIRMHIRQGLYIHIYESKDILKQAFSFDFLLISGIPYSLKTRGRNPCVVAW